MVMPGDNVAMVVELITPIAMEKGLRFAIVKAAGRSVQERLPKLVTRSLVVVSVQSRSKKGSLWHAII
jgi:hypothetical protein